MVLYFTEILDDLTGDNNDYEPEPLSATSRILGRICPTREDQDTPLPLPHADPRKLPALLQTTTTILPEIQLGGPNGRRGNFESFRVSDVMMDD